MASPIEPKPKDPSNVRRGQVAAVAGDDQKGAGDYRSARIGAAAALVAAVIIILLVDAFSDSYQTSPVVLAALLATIAGLVGVEIYDPRR